MNPQEVHKLLLDQKTEIEELLRLMRNYGCDGKDRKTKRYLEDKMLTFSEIFKVIEANHRKLIPYADDSQPYFKNKSFESLKPLYERTFENVKLRLAHLINKEAAKKQPSASGSSSIANIWENNADVDKTESKEEELELDEQTIIDLNNSTSSDVVIEEKETVGNGTEEPNNLPVNDMNESLTNNSNETVTNGTGDALTNNLPDTLANGSNETITPIDSNHQRVNQNTENNGVTNQSSTEPDDILQLQFDEFFDMLIAARDLHAESPRGVIKAYIDNLTYNWNELRKMVFKYKTSGKQIHFSYNVMQQRFMDVTGKLNDFYCASQTLGSKSVDTSGQFSLPKLKLPEFSGKSTEWKSFIAMFDKMVHNNDKIDKGTKVEYLKTCIKGQAAMIINHLDPYPENYDPCYALIRKRYDNKRELVGGLIDNILQLPKLKHENAESLKSMHDTVYESLMAVKNLGVTNVAFLDYLLCHILLKKLDPTTIVHYECNLPDVRDLQSLPSFLSYLENRFMALQSVCSKNDLHFNKQDQHFTKQMNVTPNFSSEKNSKCFLCGGDHALFKCQQFIKKSVVDRLEWAKTKKICLNCIASTSHRTHDCKSKYTCKTCSKRHHSLLHLETKKAEEKPAIRVNMANLQSANHSPKTQVQATLATQKAGTVLLATAMIGVPDKNGEMIMLRALLDQGSQSAFITETAAQTLRLPRKSIKATVSGIGATVQDAKYAIQLNIFPRFESDFVISTDAIVLNKLTRISHVDYDESDFEFLNNLCLADPSFLRESEIDIILGACEYAQVIKSGLIKSDKNIIAQNSEFGWIVSGASKTNQPIHRVVALITNVELTQQLHRLFDSDQFANDDSESLTEEEMMCEKHFESTHYRDEEGRFVVKMPFKNGLEQPELGDSKRIALASLFSLERRFIAKPELKIQYSEFINEYIIMNHMREVTVYDSEANYLPHHWVLKDSTTTKLRVVFNASQKTANKRSLNEQLAIGPTDQNDLVSILLRWRRHRIAFTADIEKMYRQIRLNDTQTHLQRILWRENEHEPIREYELCTVTYGMANAPYLAIRVLKQLASDGAVEYPLAALILKNDFYVDDVLSGADSVNEAVMLYTQLNDLMQSARFNLRKWSSNSTELMKHIPQQKQELNTINGIIKTLGVAWSTETDDLSFDISVNMETRPVTKRQLTSEIASLYDPLGYICPVVIMGKHVIQKLWHHDKNIDWDDKIPEKYIDEWQKIKSEMNFISELRIPRWINYSPDDIMELHGFCDASEVGYSAAIYIVNTTQKTSHLLVAKARVAPIKEEVNSDNVTIPRLELCGALLLAQITNKMLNIMEINFKRICLWSDSRIVLDWIHANPRRYKTFIASRISKINKLVDNSLWSHVPTDQNAADCASRGITPSELVTHSLWWHGPRFLIEKSLEPPRYNPPLVVAVHNGVGQVIEMRHNDPILPNVSSFGKLKRIIAYCMRFACNCKNEIKQTGAITADELQIAENAIIKVIQKECFGSEIDALRENNAIKRSSAVKQLSPFLDDMQILRVGGRLKNADLPYDAKHQILLPAKHAVSALIIKDVHLNCLHGAPKLTESVLRQKFWVLHSQRSIKAVIHKCVKCFKAAPKTMTQFMADLPTPRVSACEKPFTNTAVDYTGAVHVKIINGRGYKTHKAYIAIFVCMATKAIHIEAVTDMTADAFIAAYRRLVSRRGVIRNLYSDNGTNFVRSNKILQENMQTIDEHYDEAICQELAKSGTRWHFSPPGAPHFNGLAEAAVKSVKLHLKKTIADSKLTFEELSTLLTQVEACVNSRPLCPLSSDPNDVGTLTPAHFLIGESLICPPEQSHMEAKSSWLSRWQRVQQMAQYFWKRWQSDYLNQLQLRTKWREEGKTPELNDLVLIRDENLPSTQWQTGRVIDTHPGADGLTRVVSLKTSGGVMKRPIAKLCAFPTEENVSDSEKRDIKVNIAKLQRSAPKRKLGILPIITAILALFTVCSHQSPIPIKSHEITHFNVSPGFYFEKTHDVFMTHSDWKVVSHLSLRKLKYEFNTIQANLTTARDLCFTKALTHGGCRSIISHLQHKMDQIGSKNTLIFGSQRAKRSIPTLHFIGDILGDITGTLGSKFEKQYSQDLSLIHKNEEHLLLLLKNHTSVMDSTLNLLQNDEEKINKHLSAFESLCNTVGNQSNTIETESNMNNFMAYLAQIIDDYEKQQANIIDVITHSRRDHISHELFTPEQIERQVELITKQVGSEYYVPRGIEVYSVSKISVARLHDQYIFKLSIPLLGAKRFKLYKIYPVPTTKAGSLFILRNNHKFLLTSIDRQLFQYLNNYNCKPYQDKKSLICDKPNKFYTATKSDCVWNVFNHLSKEKCDMEKSKEAVFFESLNANRFLFATLEPLKITIICGDRVVHDQLVGEGMLALKPQCTLGAENVQLISKISYENETSEIVIPELDREGWTFSEPHTTTPMNLEPLRNAQKINELRTILNITNENSTLMNKHDVHHYTFSYGLIVVVVIYVAFQYWKKNKNKLGKTVSMPNILSASPPLGEVKTED